VSYHVIDPDDLDPMPDRDADAFSVSDAADLETLGMRLYVAAPGQMIPLAFHYHDEQEEAFYVVAGTLHVETPDRVYAVDPGQVFVAEPGSPHRAFNAEDATEPLRVLALGAPSVDDAHVYEGEVWNDRDV